MRLDFKSAVVGGLFCLVFALFRLFVFVVAGINFAGIATTLSPFLSCQAHKAWSNGFSNVSEGAKGIEEASRRRLKFCDCIALSVRLRRGRGKVGGGHGSAFVTLFANNLPPLVRAALLAAGDFGSGWGWLLCRSPFLVGGRGIGKRGRPYL